MENNEIVRINYDADPKQEWERLAQHPFEYEINMRFLRRYVKLGDRVLDVGDGPGRYSIALAKLGCEVTLLDLSTENVRLAKEKASFSQEKLDEIDRQAQELTAWQQAPESPEDVAKLPILSLDQISPEPTLTETVE